MPDSGGDSPTSRTLHAAACIEHGGYRPQLVITGGRDAGNKVINDVWIMDVQSGRWKKVIHASAINEKVNSLCEYIRECSIWGCNFWLQPMTDIHFQNLSSYALHKPLLALNIIFDIYLALLICDFFIVKQYFTFNSFLQNSDDVHAV